MGAMESSEGDDRLCGGACSGDRQVYAVFSSKESGVVRRTTDQPVSLQPVDREAPPQAPSERNPTSHYPPSFGHSSSSSSIDWRNSTNSDDSVGVGAYFGRMEGQTDNVARVKSLVPGGPAEQTGMIEVGDALMEVDDMDVYGKALHEVGKYVLGPPGSVVKLRFQSRINRHEYDCMLVRGKGVLTVM
mmetsp:Transcript_5337/g.11847  ORF Transcript_5337/g.11847 Transcript_5337/m.11847 type:complete len:188 (+) Transcript_5337:54-617(+)